MLNEEKFEKNFLVEVSSVFVLFLFSKGIFAHRIWWIIEWSFNKVLSESKAVHCRLDLHVVCDLNASWLLLNWCRNLFALGKISHEYKFWNEEWPSRIIVIFGGQSDGLNGFTEHHNSQVPIRIDGTRNPRPKCKFLQIGDTSLWLRLFWIFQSGEQED